MKRKTNYAVLASLLVVSASASAATVFFSSSNYADELISTNGTPIGALNLGGADGIVNTVAFTGISAATSDSTVSLAGSVTVDLFHSAAGPNNGEGAPGNAGLLTLNSIFDPPRDGGGSITFAGLTEGQSYEVQMVFSDTRSGILGATHIDLWGNATGTGPVEHSTFDLSTAQLVTATFTADGTTQSIWTTQRTENVGSFDGSAAALQIRAVPEPSAAVLLGLGGLALIMRRRK